MTSQRPKDAFISPLRFAYRTVQHGARTKISPLASRHLSSLVARTTIKPSIRQQLLRSRIEKLTHARAQTFATTGAQNAKPRDIAILGGGITGLTAAHYLARHAPNAKITLYEGSGRLGGWIHGKLAKTGDGKHDKVLFQRGPRTLRSGRGSVKYDDLIFYDVVANLNLLKKFLAGESPHGDRYLYYPDHLVRLPSRLLTAEKLFNNVYSFLTEPLWDGIIKSGINMALHMSRERGDRKERIEQMTSDESVGDFFGRVCGDDRVVRNVLSAIFHGIYGGDIYKLSMKHTVFAPLWRENAWRTPTSETWMEIKDLGLVYDIHGSPNYPRIRDWASRAVNWDLMMYDDGLLSLAHGLERDLKAQNNVSIETNSRVTSLAHNKNKVLVKTANRPNQAKQYDQVISTLFSKQLAEIVEPKGLLPSLADTHAVTIMVVNLWFPNPHLLDGNHGFGYLVPQSTPGNDECLLGVLFDSDLNIPGEPAGTKLTVMLGGHYWDGWTIYPTEEMGREMALDLVRRHLRISPDEEVIASAQLCRDCLPQHHVGHRERMKEAHYELLAGFKGQLSVAGPSYTPVGVLPAMRAGFDIAMRVAYGRGPPWYRRPEDVEKLAPPYRVVATDHVGETGLQSFAQFEMDTIRHTPRSELEFRRWSQKVEGEGGEGGKG
ncbi:Protoporphyrinogen oxidase [Hypoxylon sp. FL0890]|nr:Protoporphyrinogen oxidase [Hypoxylon sp. FL0890]